MVFCPVFSGRLVSPSLGPIPPPQLQTGRAQRQPRGRGASGGGSRVTRWRCPSSWLLPVWRMCCDPRTRHEEGLAGWAGARRGSVSTWAARAERAGSGMARGRRRGGSRTRRPGLGPGRLRPGARQLLPAVQLTRRGPSSRPRPLAPGPLPRAGPARVAAAAPALRLLHGIPRGGRRARGPAVLGVGVTRGRRGASTTA